MTEVLQLFLFLLLPSAYLQNHAPSRAEVTDVATAILEGADAVMLSDETAKGKYPVEAVIMMEKIIIEAEKHLSGSVTFNQLKSI